MEILIFENEFKEIEGAFKGLKIIMDNEINFTVVKSSQELGLFSKLYAYDIVFVDLDLVPSSKMTGYDILKKIKEDIIEKKPNVYVITGHSTGKEELERRGLSDYQILEKPFGMDDLQNLINSI
ncbi:MAG: response regulator [Flavobacteriales bacterium]|jgi:DNA-binding NtrC family response regulator|nr:response regulator [Flavobacteriales bacterium]